MYAVFAEWQRKGSVQFLAVVGLLVGAGLAFGTHDARAGDLAAIHQRGKLVVLVYPVQVTRYPAVSLKLEMMKEGVKLTDLHDPADYRGGEVDLLKGFAQSLGVGLEIRPVPGGFADLLPALVKDEGDMVASGLSITPKRLELADFTEPYFTIWLAVVARPGSKIASLADLTGKKGAVTAGTSHLEFLRTLVPGAQVEVTDFELENFVAIEEGRADYTLTATQVGPGERVEGVLPDIRMAFRVRELNVGMAVRKGSDLKAALDSYLKTVKTSGEMTRILDRNAVPHR